MQKRWVLEKKDKEKEEKEKIVVVVMMTAARLVKSGIVYKCLGGRIGGEGEGEASGSEW